MLNPDLVEYKIVNQDDDIDLESGYDSRPNKRAKSWSLCRLTMTILIFMLIIGFCVLTLVPISSSNGDITLFDVNNLTNNGFAQKSNVTETNVSNDKIIEVNRNKLFNQQKMSAILPISNANKIAKRLANSTIIPIKTPNNVFKTHVNSKINKKINIQPSVLPVSHINVSTKSNVTDKSSTHLVSIIKPSQSKKNILGPNAGNNNVKGLLRTSYSKISNTSNNTDLQYLKINKPSITNNFQNLNANNLSNKIYLQQTKLNLSSNKNHIQHSNITHSVSKKQLKLPININKTMNKKQVKLPNISNQLTKNQFQLPNTNNFPTKNQYKVPIIYQPSEKRQDKFPNISHQITKNQFQLPKTNKFPNKNQYNVPNIYYHSEKRQDKFPNISNKTRKNQLSLLNKNYPLNKNQFQQSNINHPLSKDNFHVPNITNPSNEKHFMQQEDEDINKVITRNLIWIVCGTLLTCISMCACFIICIIGKRKRGGYYVTRNNRSPGFSDLHEADKVELLNSAD